jgi:dipeptidyl aminopeptidase/acylaminoacyl peptidase
MRLFSVPTRIRRSHVPALLIIIISLSSATMSIAAGVSLAKPADTHPFGLNDYSALKQARAISVSRDGKTILYVVGHDGDKGPPKREWRLIDVSGENSRKLELPENFRPSGFMPTGSSKDDASLFGLYEVEKKGQLAIVPLTSGKPTRILAMPNGIRNAVISPDGTRFALLGDPRPKDPLAEVHHVAENDVTSIYVVSVNAVGANGAEGVWWAPELTSVADIAWSGDSAQLAVVTQSPKIGNHDFRSNIYVCKASGARRVAEIANATSGIAWADNGKSLAFASTTTDVLTPDHLWTVSVAGGKPIDRTPKLQGTITGVWGDPRGNVWAEMHRGTLNEIYAYKNETIELAYSWPGGVVQPQVFSPLASSTDAIAFTVGDPAHSFNIAVVREGKLRLITHEGDDTLSATRLGEVRVVSWTAKDGTKLEGILTLPGDYQAGKKYPFVVLPHGGPEGNDTLSFDLFARLIAGWGYVAMQPQYRGSTGYGSDFMQAIYQHFGDRAYSDVDSATDFAIAQGWADPNRLAIFGWSAGGFMTAWTVTQTNRYKAAIEGAGITDWLSFIPTSDIAQVDYDMRLQEKDPAPLLQFSAVMHADKVTTPLLILHGEADLRVPHFQGREFFILLAERGKTVRMVSYPGSPHFPRLAEQRRDVFTEIQHWLERYNP